MKDLRVLLLGALASAGFVATWWVVSLMYGLHGEAESAVIASIVFASLAPLFDRFSLGYIGDTGPRVFWTGLAWVAPLVAMAAGADPAQRHFFSVLCAIGGGPAAVFAVDLRRLGLRSATLRRIMPWLALVITLLVVFEVAWKLGAATLPGLALVAIATSVHALFFRGGALARHCGLDGTWEHAQMSADGTVTLDELPPMHAPAGVRPLAGPVLVQLSQESAATFRMSGAPTILRVVQGMDVDLEGRCGILDEGAKAYATATALLPAAALLAALSSR